MGFLVLHVYHQCNRHKGTKDWAFFWLLFEFCTCAAEAIFCCPIENSHHLKSWITSKDAAFHNEKESRRTWARSQVSLEKSSKNYSRWENEPNPTSCKHPPPPPAKSNGEYFPRVFHVATPDPPNSPAVATRHSGWQLLGERAGWSAVWYNSLTGW